MNCLLGTTDYSTKEFEISLFKNKQGYAGISLQDSNGIRADWKFQRDDVPEVPKVLVSGKEVSDFTNIDKFYRTEMDEWIKTTKFFDTPSPTGQALAHAEEVFGEEFPSSLENAPAE
jgi:hypothetical protein